VARPPRRRAPPMFALPPPSSERRASKDPSQHMQRTFSRVLPGAAARHGLLPLRGFSRLMFIQTAQTPNPDSLKFLPGRAVMDFDAGTRNFLTYKEAQASPLAKRIFQTEGVTNVMLANDYIAVTKSADSDWLTVKPQIFASIMDFYAAGELVLGSDDVEEEDSLEIKDDDSEVVQMIKELLDMRIRPSVQEDGGDIKFHGFDEENGVVSLEMQGSCSGCPSSSVTLKSGIENMLMHYIPEVKEVTDVGAAQAEGE
jgi:Fe-S cluster biogenesis protein NfuA